METEVQSNFTYLRRTFTDLNINASSSTFSDCNSDRSGEFPIASSQSRRLFLSCASENSDELIEQLVSDVESSLIDEQNQVATEIILLAKNKLENRIKIARPGAIKPLISLIASSDPQLQENGVTAILNLSLCDENKELIAASGAIKSLVRALKIGNSTARENAATQLKHF
ncbi:PREDICTED: protein spotted leaf 11-like [Nicotiana attenuata]|uniref:protein spotted leaf 11-like n=1 Tax=Nicotiana attenuata TaxID=49451 RepID=UPI000905C2E0|nr:PREDICTED: protein spotted leaf 11-like [Nicotiana attenuata]